MRLAIIKDGLVINRITTVSESGSELFLGNNEIAIRVCNLTPEPQIGWSYDSQNETFLAPEVSE